MRYENPLSLALALSRIRTLSLTHTLLRSLFRSCPLSLSLSLSLSFSLCLTRLRSLSLSLVRSSLLSLFRTLSLYLYPLVWMRYRLELPRTPLSQSIVAGFWSSLESCPLSELVHLAVARAFGNRSILTIVVHIELFRQLPNQSSDYPLMDQSQTPL